MTSYNNLSQSYQQVPQFSTQSQGSARHCPPVIQSHNPTRMLYPPVPPMWMPPPNPITLPDLTVPPPSINMCPPIPPPGIHPPNFEATTQENNNWSTNINGATGGYGPRVFSGNAVRNIDGNPSRLMLNSPNNNAYLSDRGLNTGCSGSNFQSPVLRPSQSAHVRPQLPGNIHTKRPFNTQLQSNKKQRSNPTEFPHECITCDRRFKLLSQYQEHVSQHVQCKYDGCVYVAAKKLVDLHVQCQHKTGLAKKIWQKQDPEEIAKWRAERKMNYPTAENIAQKKLLAAQRIERGDVLKANQSFFKNKHSTLQITADPDKLKTNPTDIQSKDKNSPEINEESNNLTELVLKEFSEIVNDKEVQQPKAMNKPKKKQMPKNSTNKLSKSATLLQKLLQPDIIHERNVLLQCVRYVVKNNFFDASANDSKTEDIQNKAS